MTRHAYSYDSQGAIRDFVRLAVSPDAGGIGRFVRFLLVVGSVYLVAPRMCQCDHSIVITIGDVPVATGVPMELNAPPAPIL